MVRSEKSVYSSKATKTFFTTFLRVIQCRSDPFNEYISRRAKASTMQGHVYKIYNGHGQKYCRRVTAAEHEPKLLSSEHNIGSCY